MSYLKFDKSQLVNLEYSTQREVLRSNRAGSYISTTLSGCNTRKYHGLLVCPIDELDGGKHVLLSSLDETVIQHGAAFNLGIHKFEGDHYEPKGHKYIRNFEMEIIPKTTYRVGGVVLSKERLLVEKEQQVLIKYTLEDAHSPTILRFRPFLAFRNVHTLSKANLYAHTKYKKADKGIKLRLYDGYPYLHLQFSKDVEFVPVPDWYYGIEYTKEQNRGYEFKEDLFVPGYFELPIKKGESIVFSAATFEANPVSLRRKFGLELNKRIPRTTFLDNLRNAAQQFIVKSKTGSDVIAGFPWYSSRTRQTFVALPGLTLDMGNSDTFIDIIDKQVSKLKDGLFPKIIGKYDSGYDSIDASLWFFWALQQYNHVNNDPKYIWDKYGSVMKTILSAYKKGTAYNIKMADNGLISGKTDDISLTWMDSYVNGSPVVQRPGMPVEVNALWYNAICFAVELAEINKDQSFVDEWKEQIVRIGESFINSFWLEERHYLADYIDEGNPNWAIRPNMVIAAALEYSPLDKEKQKAVLDIVRKELLTSRGLRTLSPRDPAYLGVCEGDVTSRELAIHQGTAWPWLILFFVEGYLKIYKRSGVPFLRSIIEGFEEEMTEHCIGTISEMYNGNPPHRAKGAVSQAWSVAAVIRAYKLLANYEKNEQ